MKDYYQVLGLESNASAKEIKSRFRELVIRYHPDRNSTPIAADLIREINEAYGVLGDPDKKFQYDYRRTNETFRQQQPRVHRDPAYRPSENRRPVVSSQFLMMKQCLPFITKLIYFSLVFCAFLLLDLLLPKRIEEQVIVNKGAHIAHGRGNGYYSSDVIYTNKGTWFEIDLDNSEKLAEGAVIFISFTRILDIPMWVSDGVNYSVRIPVTIFGNFIFAPVLLLILSILGFFFRKNVSLTFNLGVTIFFILLLCFYFLIIS